MTFTYDLAAADADTLNIAKVRLEIGDTVSGTGVRADGSNLTDEEIQTWLDTEGDDVMRATARACEMLARDWARAASIAVGPRREQLSDVSKAYAEQAKALREQHGGEATAFSANWARQDGYHDRVISLDYSDDPYGEDAR